MDDAKKIFKIENERKLSDFNSVKINTALVGEYYGDNYFPNYFFGGLTP